MNDLSVIISAYDQHNMTVAHVKGCMESKYLPKEIIVVNDGGDPSLLDMLRDIPKKCPIVYARVTKDIPWNQQGARNLGLWLSNGRYVATEDNDHIPHPDFYGTAVDSLAKDEADYIVPKTRYVIDQSDMDKPMSEWKTLRTRGHAMVIATCKRELLTDIKGYDEQFSGRYGWEIPDLRNRLKCFGARVKTDGAYYTFAGAYSRLEDREHDGRQFKMDPINYHHCKRNERNMVTQGPIGILNFNFTINRL